MLCELFYSFISPLQAHAPESILIKALCTSTCAELRGGFLQSVLELRPLGFGRFCDESYYDSDLFHSPWLVETDQANEMVSSKEADLRKRQILICWSGRRNRRDRTEFFELRREDVLLCKYLVGVGNEIMAVLVRFSCRSWKKGLDHERKG